MSAPSIHNPAQRFDAYFLAKCHEQGLEATTSQQAISLLLAEVATQQNPTPSKKSWFSFGAAPRALFTEGSRGVYLWGDVGRGKTFLMDNFCGYLAQFYPEVRVKRQHFYSFMTDIHRQLQELREHRGSNQSGPSHGGQQLLAHLAGRLAAQIDWLCFDEFQVTNIADAMILGRLFEKLLTGGVRIFITSNQGPDQLYLNGLNRQSFLPFITLLKNQLRVVYIEGQIDHRRAAYEKLLKTKNALEVPSVEAIFMQAAEGIAPSILWVDGRRWVLEKTTKGSVLLSFAEICGQALGGADYRQLAKNFKMIFLKDIPSLTDENLSEVQRFIVFVDVVYDCKTPLIWENKNSSLYTGHVLQEVFKRTESRLAEMATWIA